MPRDNDDIELSTGTRARVRQAGDQFWSLMGRVRWRVTATLAATVSHRELATRPLEIFALMERDL